MRSQTLVRTPFGFASTAEEVLAGVDLAGSRAIVTGGASGLGRETARALAAAGAEVVLAVRDPRAGADAAAQITATTGNPAVRALPLDVANLRSVDGFAGAWDGPVDILVDNAGVMGIPERTLTADGWELQLATNYLGHLALAQGLRPALAASGRARIVAVTSRGHFRSPVVLEDLHFARRDYDPMDAYGQAKTATILFAVEASRRWASDGITANAAFPGVALSTGLDRHLSAEVVQRKLADRNTKVKTVEQAAATIVLAAASPHLDGIGGRYLQDNNEAPVVDDLGPSTTAGVAPFAVDPAIATQLWDLTTALIADQRKTMTTAVPAAREAGPR
jgi:NAD(P)-dependent dehydrogenase (short-subunit alcohol dehydrogenase family)